MQATTDILPEQLVARMLANRERIVAEALAISGEQIVPRDEQAARHLNAYGAACDLREFLEAAHLHSDHELIDKARQLEAFHLWHLDGAIPF